MDFDGFRERTEAWCNSGNTNFSIVDSNESERKLTLLSGNVSFYVILPEEQSKNLSVWSENDEVLRYLEDVVDRLSSCKQQTLEETLNLVNAKLAPLFGASNNDSDDEGISDGSYDEDDAYDVMNYPDDDDVPDVTPQPAPEATDGAAAGMYSGQGSVLAVQRLLKDMKNLLKVQGKIGVQGQPRDDNLFLWDVKLVDIPSDTQLGKDVLNYSKKHNRENCISIEMSFPQEYPFQPPFVRITRPRFKFLTGHVTIGGSICMELLTRSGWNPVNDIESVLVQIRAEILSDPNARLDSNPDRDYDATEARNAFKRMVQRYGWE